MRTRLSLVALLSASLAGVAHADDWQPEPGFRSLFNGKDLFFHAHPDDEALLTSGTMAKLAAQGHRVVLVVATAGEAGLVVGRTARGRAARRPAAGRTAGVRGRARGEPAGGARVRRLGAAPSPTPPPPPGRLPRLVDADIDEAAAAACRRSWSRSTPAC